MYYLNRYFRQINYNLIKYDYGATNSKLTDNRQLWKNRITLKYSNFQSYNLMTFNVDVSKLSYPLWLHLENLYIGSLHAAIVDYLMLMSAVGRRSRYIASLLLIIINIIIYYNYIVKKKKHDVY